MFRYVALVWNDSVRAHSEAADLITRTLRSNSTGLTNVLDRNGLRVFCTRAQGASTAYLLDNGAGVVLGTLFDRLSDASGGTRSAEPDHLMSRHIQETSGRALVDSYWGRYVAFVFDPTGRRIRVVRDPTGDIECLSCEQHGVTIFFSSMQDCALLRQAPFSINWNYVHAASCIFLCDTRETGLNGVSRVLRGECWDIGPDSVTRSFYWHPIAISRSAPIEDASTAISALRHTTRSCIHAWASCYARVLQMLSGGLDSSIVAGCLSEAPSHPEVTCLNHFYLSGSAGDERQFARLAAKRAGFPLIERELDPHFSLDRILAIPLHASPSNFVLDLGVYDTEHTIATNCAAEARFSGFGGDQLFFQAGADFAYADYIRRFGITPGVIGRAVDTARRRAVGVWSVLGKGVRDALFSRSIDRVRNTYTLSKLVLPSIAESVATNRIFLHPWLDHAGTLPLTGKYLQLSTFVANTGMYGPLSRPEDPEDVSPLFSQPVLELCLRIPTYILTDGRTDRTIARRAFETVLPPEVVKRRAKGSVVEYPKAIMEWNTRFLREMLLDGALVRERIVDRKKLESVLSGEPTKDYGYPWEMFTLLSIEAWLERWSSARRTAAA